MQPLVVLQFAQAHADLAPIAVELALELLDVVEVDHRELRRVAAEEVIFDVVEFVVQVGDPRA